MHQFLNYFFFVFHTLLILFNITGWAFKATRKWNLLTLCLTGFSWFIIGIWKGWGYCYCTDWHWDVRKELGYADQTNSYVHFLILKLTGAVLSLELVETATAGVYFASLAVSLALNIRDRRKG